jgi:hypothetical protein
VLVDILVRDDDGKIEIKGGKLQIHTIVLCRTSKEDEFLVVDPSKVSHSSHIVGTGIYDRGFTIIAPKISDIYIPEKDNVGPNPSQFRDCIDIAVKLAFGFEVQEGNAVNALSLSSNEVVLMVSNNPNLDTVALAVVSDVPVRVKQRSDLSLSEIFKKMQELLRQDLDKLKVVDKGKDFSAPYKKVLSDPENIDDKKMFANLFSVHEFLRDYLSEDLNKREEELQGILGNNNAAQDFE